MNQTQSLNAKARRTDRSTDRQVLYALLLVGVLAMLMMVAEVLDRLEVKSYFLQLYASLELALEFMVVASVAWGGKTALGEMKRRGQGLNGHRTRRW